ncbi:phage tail fiber protein [Nocardiopsis synnemataformans]|uniref:phage tail fiber protein n=1 Tax=Nocardiopsis synnemataformans TaxID=61305 RepID=UPI003EB9E2DC
MAFTNALYHPMLSAAATTAVEASLHIADPGSTGASEVTGGGYARQPVAWQPPADGAIRATDAIVFDVPSLGSGEITHVGLWSSAGAWLGGIPAAVPQPYPSPGTATVEPLTLDMATGVLAASISSE